MAKSRKVFLNWFPKYSNNSKFGGQQFRALFWRWKQTENAFWQLATCRRELFLGKKVGNPDWCTPWNWHEIEQVAYNMKIVDVDTYFYSDQRKSIATLKRNKFPNIYFVIWYCIYQDLEDFGTTNCCWHPKRGQFYAFMGYAARSVLKNGAKVYLKPHKLF